MRRQEFNLPQSPNIDRPADRWVCGNADKGYPCAHGPDQGGHCPVMGACQPVANEDSWTCARPACLGGKCDDGPSSEGVCGLQPEPCVPRPSWRYRRRHMIIAGIAGSASILLLMLGLQWETNPLRPGPLTSPHRQILASRLSSDKCAACHPAASGSLVSWFVSVKGAHQGVSQSQKCVACHHGLIEPKRSRLAHNLTSDELRLTNTSTGQSSSTWVSMLTKFTMELDDVACATCHREHHGEDFNLSALNNNQCQTCHKATISDFATDHPSWGDWPYGRSSAIAFNHATHIGKHFSASIGKGGAKFHDCRACHAITETGDLTRVTSFETACSTCHVASLQVELSDGFTLLSLPDIEEPPAKGLGEWPSSRIGSYDGRIAPLTQLLIAHDPKVADALQQLPPGADFLDIDPSDDKQSIAAITIAVAIRQLFDDIAIRGKTTVIERLQHFGVDATTASELIRSLPPQLVYDARERWFDNPPSVPVTETQSAAKIRDRNRSLKEGSAIQLVSNFNERIPNPLRLRKVPLDQKGSLKWPRIAQLSPPVSSDQTPQPNDPVAQENTDSPQSSEKVVSQETNSKPVNRDDLDINQLTQSGGWYQDEDLNAIRYRGTKHGDTVLKAMIDVLSQIDPNEPIHASLLSQQSVAACVRCHQLPPKGQKLHWTGTSRTRDQRTFTKFSHQPHMNISQLSDCRQCHQIRGLTSDNVRLISSNHHSAKNTSEFLPIGLQTCASCHTAKGAGDRCTKCHNYHINPIHWAEKRSTPLMQPLSKEELPQIGTTSPASNENVKR